MIHFLVHLLLLALRASESDKCPPLPSRSPNFGPNILSSTTASEFPLGFVKCYLLLNIIVEGTKCFKFILAVHDLDGGPCLFVAAESDLAGERPNELSLGVYAPLGYENLGTSNSLGDIGLFQDVAVEVARTRLGAEVTT